MKLFSLAAVMLLAAAPQPQKVSTGGIPMPSRSVYNEACLRDAIKYYGTQHDDGNWRWKSSNAFKVGLSYCSCEYNTVKHEPFFYNDLSHNARQSCHAEHLENFDSTVLKYLRIFVEWDWG